MKIKNYITYIILFIFASINFYLGGIVGLLEFILTICLYTILFFFIYSIWNKIRKKETVKPIDFINYFLQRLSIIIVIITTFIGGLSYLSNEIYPAPMPEYTITNGTKEVKFQAMSHIGTESFYNTIVKNLTEYKNNGGVYFFEGVKPGTQENAEKFNTAIGMEFDADLYKNFSKLYGVINQDNSIFLGLANDLDFNVDLNMDEIVENYEEKTKDNEKEYESKVPVDANKVIIETLSKLNDKQLKILVYVNQAILNFIIGSDSTQNFLTDNFANKDLFEVILGKRNEVLSNEIINSEYNKIYITYGLLHFKGVFELLKQNDSNWKIVETKNLYPIK